MLEFLKRLNAKKLPSSADLRAALDKIDEAGLANALLNAESTRRVAILAGEPEGLLDQHDAAVAAAERALGRARIARVELEARLDEAIKREAEAALDRERDEAEREAAACAEVLARNWPPAQRILLDLLARLDAAEQRVRAVNQRLIEADRTDIVTNVEYRARRRPEFANAEVYSLKNRTVLPPIPDWDLAGHGHLPEPAAFWSGPAGRAAE